MSEALNPHEHRFQEIESLLAQLINSQKHLLQAQVIMHDRQDKTESHLNKAAEVAEGTERRLGRLSETVEQIAESHKQIAESHKHSDARLDALIAVVDDLVRKNGKGGIRPQ